MAYCTQAQIESAITAAKVLDLTDDEGTGAETATTIARITEAIRKADGEIDGYLQAHYDVPVDSPSGSMTNVIAISLAVYYLHQRRYGSFGLPEAVKEEYDRRVAQLEKINRGTLDLGQDAVATPSSKIIANESGPAKLFYGATGTASGSLDEF